MIPKYTGRATVADVLGGYWHHVEHSFDSPCQSCGSNRCKGVEFQATNYPTLAFIKCVCGVTYTIQASPVPRTNAYRWELVRK